MSSGGLLDALPLATAQVLLEMLMASGPCGSWGAMIYSWVALDSLLQWSPLGGPGTMAFLVCMAAVLIESWWQLPRAGVATLHRRHGNWLELSCALALIASMVLALRRGAAAVTA